jgi:hypothetical protein
MTESIRYKKIMSAWDAAPLVKATVTSDKWNVIKKCAQANLKYITELGYFTFETINFVWSFPLWK